MTPNGIETQKSISEDKIRTKVGEATFNQRLSLHNNLNPFLKLLNLLLLKSLVMIKRTKLLWNLLGN